MIYLAFFISALFSPFFFPWQYTATLAVLASWRYPFAPLIVGIEFDILYMIPNSSSFMMGTTIGGLITVTVFFIKYLTKKYIRNV